MELARLLAIDAAVGGDTQIGDGLATGGVAQFGIAGSIADEDDFVDAFQLSAPPLAVAASAEKVGVVCVGRLTVTGRRNFIYQQNIRIR